MKLSPQPQHLLVVDDDPEMRALLHDVLRKVGFEVDCIATGAELIQRMAQQPEPSLVLMDLHLRNESGFVLARQLRQSYAVPIVMLSGNSEEIDRVLALEVVVDDFLLKPFSPRDLVARLRAVLRRCGAAPLAAGREGQDENRSEAGMKVSAVAAGASSSTASSGGATSALAAGSESLQFGEWVLNLGTRELRSLATGMMCPLTQGEFRILETLVRHPRRVWTRDQLLEQTRSAETEVYDRTIDVLVLRLRRKIEPNQRHPQFICTERGMGYMFAADVTKIAKRA